MAQIDALFDELLARKGSDLHLGIGYPPLVRRQGELEALRDAPIDANEMEDLLYEIIGPGEKEQLKSELDLELAYSYDDKARFRASYFHKHTGLAAVFRAIPSKPLTLKELAFPEALRGLAERRSGLVLVTGPAGSGKSTTIAAMLDHINATRACHILTIEDPVEFVHQPAHAQITHRQIGPDAGSYPAALGSAAREDADVIFVSELRTTEAMKLALSLACSGLLVFATMHSTSAPATLDRVVNAFPADDQPLVRAMLAECVAGVVAQQLLRTADGKGRVAAHEILLASTQLSAMIREGKTSQVPLLIQAGSAMGMTTMDAALELLVGRRVITPDEALERATDKEGFQKLTTTTRRTGAPPPMG